MRNKVRVVEPELQKWMLVGERSREGKMGRYPEDTGVMIDRAGETNQKGLLRIGRSDWTVTSCSPRQKRLSRRSSAAPDLPVSLRYVLIRNTHEEGRCDWAGDVVAASFGGMCDVGEDSPAWRLQADTPQDGVGLTGVETDDAWWRDSAHVTRPSLDARSARSSSPLSRQQNSIPQDHAVR